MLGFAPVALVIGIFPGAGHHFFRNWLGKLGAAIFIKALYLLVIAIVVAISAALTSSTTSLGFLFAFGLQAVFFWAIFLYRKQITARLVAATTGTHYDERLPRMTAVQKAGNVAARPFSALVGFGMGQRAAKQQESAIAGTTGPGPEHPPAAHDRSDPNRRRRRRSSSNGAPVISRSDVVDADGAHSEANGDVAHRSTDVARFSAGTPVRVYVRDDRPPNAEQDTPPPPAQIPPPPARRPSRVPQLVGT